MILRRIRFLHTRDGYQLRWIRWIQATFLDCEELLSQAVKACLPTLKSEREIALLAILARKLVPHGHPPQSADSG